MEIEQSSLYREIEQIITSPAKPVSFVWVAQIHANGETHNALKVLSLDIVCDYELKYADEILLTVMLPGGTYAKRIYPYQTTLEITLFKYPLNETGEVGNPNAPLETERYTATLLDKGNPIVEGNASNAPTEDALNLTSMMEIQFQLVNKALEQLRMISVGGKYRYCTVEEVVKAVLTNESKKVQVEGIRLPLGVDMVPASNKAQRDHVILPQGMRLVDVPEYIQAKCGGIYSAGLGYYLQGDYWYVYPCYDTERLNQATQSMTIINVPTNKFPGIERTYRVDGSNTVVMATGQVKLVDDSEAQQLNLGNGVRFADATKFMEGFAKTENNRTVVNRGLNNSEFISTPRENGNNNVQLSENAITANAYVEYSKLARRQGSFLNLVWENSLPALVFPGMMIKVLYLDNDEIREIQGVILKVHHFIHLRGQGMTANRHISNSMLSIFIQRKAK